MMHQKIVAEPSMPQQLIDDTIALSTTAEHIRTLVDCCVERLKALKKCGDQQAVDPQLAEWSQIEHLLNIIEEKADQVERVSVAVLNA